MTQPIRELTPHFYLSPWLRMCGAIPPLLGMPLLNCTAQFITRDKHAALNVLKYCLKVKVLWFVTSCSLVEPSPWHLPLQSSAVFSPEPPGTGPKTLNYSLAPCKPVYPPSCPLYCHTRRAETCRSDLVWRSEQIVLSKLCSGEVVKLYFGADRVFSAGWVCFWWSIDIFLWGRGVYLPRSQP
jgi:hypothetical protein